ncbi:MerR family transcriptional regulator [Mumia zhuanghuii]|uniref:MerR family transcriptional regulator n=2 Tax=Mumia TaxID=1546255 RepID=A0ABW1QHG9_9ACTN|nr:MULTISPECIES: MerR family transcriptional regulator [Mumia]KAA1424645.1 MerR family transcriptional regulator [Mumia zhuanghuii]
MTPSERLSVEQLAERVGMSVRTIRFYAGRGLIPPPVREGRNGFYGADHLARLELVRELQAHGFTLSAIEGYLERLPADATPGDVALQRTMLAPWLSDLPEAVDRETLERRAGRSLSDDDIELLVALRVVEPTPDEDLFRVAPAHLSVGIGLMNLGLPVDGAIEAERIIESHARAMAEELTEVFRVKVLPHYRASGEPPEAIAAIIEQFKPLTVQALVTAYESAVNETKRATIRRRT